MAVTQLSTTGGSHNARRVVTLSTGRRVGFINVAGGVAIQVSDDFGETWYTCTTPVNGIVDARTDSIVAADPDSDNGIHVLLGCNTATSQQTLDYLFVTVAGLVASVTRTQVKAAAGVDFAWYGVELTVHSGANGASKNLLLAYNKANIAIAPGPQTLTARSASVTTGGVITLGAEFTIASNSENSTRYVFGIAKNAAGVCKLLYQQWSTIKVAAATLTAPLTVAPPQTTYSTTCNFMEGLTAIDGLPTCMWMGHETGGLWFWHETDHTGPNGEWKRQANATNDTKPTLAVLADTTAAKLLVAAPQGASPNYLKLLEIDVATKAVTDKGVWGLQTVNFPYPTVRTYDGQSIPVLYIAAGGTYMEVYGSPFAMGYHMII